MCCLCPGFLLHRNEESLVHFSLFAHRRVGTARPSFCEGCGCFIWCRHEISQRIGQKSRKQRIFGRNSFFKKVIILNLDSFNFFFFGVCCFFFFFSSHLNSLKTDREETFLVNTVFCLLLVKDRAGSEQTSRALSKRHQLRVMVVFYSIHKEHFLRACK